MAFQARPKTPALPLKPLSTLFCAYFEAVRLSPYRFEVERLADGIALELVDARARRFSRVCIAFLHPGPGWRNGALSAPRLCGATLNQ